MCLGAWEPIASVVYMYYVHESGSTSREKQCCQHSPAAPKYKLKQIDFITSACIMMKEKAFIFQNCRAVPKMCQCIFSAVLYKLYNSVGLLLIFYAQYSKKD